mgnify:CR=1 FL=1
MLKHYRKWIKPRRKKIESDFSDLMSKPYSTKKSLGMHFKHLNPKTFPARYSESQKLMYTVGKPLKQAGKTKQLKQFKLDMLGLTSKSYLNKYL